MKAALSPYVGSTIVANGHVVRIPPQVHDLKTFRQWFHSNAFPEEGRVCYLHGEVWVDMSKEQFFSHNQVKQEFNRGIGSLAKASQRGRYVPDGMLVTNVAADLSCQPDGTFVSTESLQSGRIRLVEGKRGGYLELEGTPDMVLEIVSDASVTKDLETLHELYWRAGIPEYWLVDVRGEALEFTIFQRGPRGYVATRRQSGWLKSKVFGKSFRLSRHTDTLGHPEYTLDVR
jgi:Uma2 family endonuclease